VFIWKIAGWTTDRHEFANVMKYAGDYELWARQHYGIYENFAWYMVGPYVEPGWNVWLRGSGDPSWYIRQTGWSTDYRSRSFHWWEVQNYPSGLRGGLVCWPVGFAIHLAPRRYGIRRE